MFSLIDCDNMSSFVVYFVDCLKEKESQLCSTFFKVLAILEYVPNNLEKEVNNRIELK